MRFPRATACVLAASAFSRIAGAGEPIRFEYDAPEGCPDQAAFVERVRARSQRGKFAEPGELARTFTITVRVGEAASTAKVEFVDTNGETVVRAVSGETCDEVISGIALVTALAIDARAGEEASSEPLPPPAEKPKPAELPKSPPTDGPVPTQPTPQKGLRWGFGMSGAVNTWSSPDLAYGAGFFGEIDLGEESFPRLVRLSAMRLTSSTFADDRNVLFTWTGARLSACPVSAALTENLAFVPCLAADLGALTGEGVPSSAFPAPDEDTIFLPTGLLLAELRYNVGDFLVFEGRGELGFPLRERTFEFRDRDEPVFEVPRLGFGGGVGVGLLFP